MAMALLIGCFFDINLAFADEIKPGGGNLPVAPKPAEALPDFYFFAIIGVFLLICYEIITLILLIIKMKKQKVIVGGIIPYAIASAFSLKSVEIFLTAEIVVFAILFFTKRVLKRKYEKMNNGL